MAGVAVVDGGTSGPGVRGTVAVAAPAVVGVAGPGPPDNASAWLAADTAVGRAVAGKVRVGASAAG